MSDHTKIKLHAIIAEITKISNDIEELKKKRNALLDKFKQLQDEEEVEPGTIIKLR
jgi:FtsZ-binding cell division protein ZapB